MEGLNKHEWHSYWGRPDAYECAKCTMIAIEGEDERFKTPCTGEDLSTRIASGEINAFVSILHKPDAVLATRDDFKHVTDAAWERCEQHTLCTRSAYEKWYSEGGLFLCATEEWKARGNDADEEKWTRYHEAVNKAALALQQKDAERLADVLAENARLKQRLRDLEPTAKPVTNYRWGRPV